MVMLKNKLFFMIVLLLVLAFLFSGCSGNNPGGDNSPPVIEVEVEPEPLVIEIAAVGDFLMHMPVINAAWNADINNYDFAPQLKDVRQFLTEPDITIANLETRLAGRDNRGYSGYPLFNCPEQLALGMAQSGIDVVLTANNHSLDRGFNGLVKTLDHLDAAGLKHVGNYRTREERNPLVIDANGIKVGILNYTESTNGIPLPQGKEFAVDMIDYQLMANDIQELNSLGVDTVVVCLHFGIEYQRFPNPLQKEIVDRVFEMGADIIFGNHVHVIQPMEKRTVIRDNREHEVFVIYSLGNFISNQRWQYSDSGVIANVQLEKDLVNNYTKIKKVDYVPTWVHTYVNGGKVYYRVVAVEKAINDYENQTDRTISAADYKRLKEVWQETTSHLTCEEQGIFPRSLLRGE